MTNKEFKKLQKENEKLREKVEDLMDDFNMTPASEGGSREDLWLLINELIENEIQQEKLCTDTD